MPNVPIFITSLARKLAELEAERDYHQKRVDRAVDAIAKITATLDLFEEGKWTRYQKARHDDLGPFKPRELPRLIVQVLREAGKPLMAREIMEAVMTTSGLVADDEKQRKRIRKRVTEAISDKHRLGIIRSAGKVGMLTLWELDPDGVNPRAEASKVRNAARSEKRRLRSAEIQAGLRDDRAGHLDNG